MSTAWCPASGRCSSESNLRHSASDSLRVTQARVTSLMLLSKLEPKSQLQLSSSLAAAISPPADSCSLSGLEPLAACSSLHVTVRVTVARPLGIETRAVTRTSDSLNISERARWVACLLGSTRGHGSSGLYPGEPSRGHDSLSGIRTRVGPGFLLGVILHECTGST